MIFCNICVNGDEIMVLLVFWAGPDGRESVLGSDD